MTDNEAETVRNPYQTVDGDRKLARIPVQKTSRVPKNPEPLFVQRFLRNKLQIDAKFSSEGRHEKSIYRRVGNWRNEEAKVGMRGIEQIHPNRNL